jgi:hypothetical protein
MDKKIDLREGLYKKGLCVIYIMLNLILKNFQINKYLLYLLILSVKFF